MTSQLTSDRIPPTLLLDPKVIDDPYPFYARLRREAPVWPVADSGIFAASIFDLVAEAAGRVEDFSSNLHCLMYRDERGIPPRWDYGDGGGQALATAAAAIGIGLSGVDE